MDEVATMLLYYKQSLIVAKWLQMKKKNNEPLPASDKELVAMQEVDKRVKTISMAVMFPNGMKRTGRRRGNFLS